MSNFNKLPQITWGTSFANTLNIGYPIDKWNSYSTPRKGSKMVQSQSGIYDSWVLGVDYFLECELRWIPGANTTTPLATGWDGTTGVRAFLEWAQLSNQFRWIPDMNVSGTYITSYLIDPFDKTGCTLEGDGTRNLKITIMNTSTDYSGY